MTLKELSEAISIKKYGHVPNHARPVKRLSEGSANELTKSVLAWFEFKGIMAYRQASEGRYIKGKEYTDWKGAKREEKGMYIPRSKSNKGAGDISVTLPPNARRLEIEIKFGKDKQSPEQKKFQQQIEAMGGLYMIVRTWDGFIFEINKYVK